MRFARGAQTLSFVASGEPDESQTLLGFVQSSKLRFE